MRKIAVVGTRLADTEFLYNAIKTIIELSGNNEEIEVKRYSVLENPKDSNPDLIYTQMNEPDGSESKEIYLGLLKWIRGQRHAYCMVSEEHTIGFHNYNNFRQIIVSMNMVFKPLRFDVDKENKAISPATLIDLLRPKKDEQKD